MTAIYRRYRPQTFADVAGQAHVVQTLQNQLKNGTVAQAYLFVGPRGVGKTTSARLLAKAVNCLNPGASGEPCNICIPCTEITAGNYPDVVEIDAASHTGVDNVREIIIENVRYAPLNGKKKVFIIDEVHMLSKSAFNALLKTLEEPPAHALFILATTELEKIPATISSRCQRFFFSRLTPPQITERLLYLLKTEERAATTEALQAVTRAADGSLRDAERLLEQLLGLTAGEITIADVQSLVPVAGADLLFTLLLGAAAGQTDVIVAALEQAIADNIDISRLHEQLIELVRAVLLTKLGSKSVAILYGEHTSWAEALKVVTAAQAKGILNNLIKALGAQEVSILPQINLELALIQGVGQDAAAPVAAPVIAPVVPAVAAKPAPMPTQTPVAAPAPTPAPAPEMNDISTVSFEDLKLKWKRCCEELGKKSLSLTMVMGESEPVSLEGGTATIKFARRFHYETMREGRNLGLLTDAVANVMLARIKLMPMFEEPVEDKQVQDLADAFGGMIAE